MKRLLCFLALAGIWAGAPSRLPAFNPPASPPLPNFDKRLLNLPETVELPADKAPAAARLQERIPGVHITPDRLLRAPNYIASPDGFLSGPQATGKGISPAAAQAFAPDDPHRPLKAFLQEHAALFGYGTEVLDSARIQRDYVTPHNGLRTTVWQQYLDGVAVFEAVLMSHFTRNGELVNISTRLVPQVVRAADAGVPNRAAVLAALPVSARQALVHAAQNLGDALRLDQVAGPGDQVLGPDQEQRLKAEPVIKGETIAKLTWLPVGAGEMKICWQLFVTSRSRPFETYQVLVDAQTGEVLLRRCLTKAISDATYNVYTSDSPSPFSPGHPVPLITQPPLVSRVLVTLAALNTNASPLGWISDNVNETRGNNIDAHMDWNDDNIPDTPRPQGSTNRVFDFPLDLNLDPTNYGEASVVQVFYWGNWMHDQLYDLGFTEAAGNYQEFNFGRGGLGNDAVSADVQNGILFTNWNYRNNAFFSPSPDGYQPRISMLIYDGPDPDRDSALDAEVFLHEYTHGLSERLVGGGAFITELQPSGMGEGWSDFYALSLLSEPTDDLNGNYAGAGYTAYLLAPGFRENYYFGDRRYPYSTDMTKNPLTFKDIDPTQADPHSGIPLSPYFRYMLVPPDEVHNQGEFWCMTLWEARVNLIRKYGFAAGNRQILQLVTDGMRLSPANPTYLEARDAIIQADLVNNGGANFLELWRAFAKRGLGGSATCPSSSTTIGLEEAFDMPGLAVFSASSSDSDVSNGNGAIDLNECNELTVVLINKGRTNATSVNATLSTLTPGVLVSQSDSPYPNILPGAMGTNLVPFRIYTAPDFACGTTILFEMLVRSAQETRTVRFRLETGLVGSATRFDTNTAIAIPDSDQTGVDSPVTVSGFSGILGRVTVSLHITHTFDYDLELSLIGPDGTSVLLSRNKGFGANYGNACTRDTLRTTFDDKAAQSISSASPPFVGTFRPSEPLAKFRLKTGAQVNGAWRLHVADLLNTNDTGTIQCWSLNLFPVSCSDGGGQCPADLQVTTTASPPLPVVGSNLTFNVSVSNLGASDARNVMLTNLLPVGMTFLAAIPTRGSCTPMGGTVICALGTIPDGTSAGVNILMRPTVPGTFTNFASAFSSVPDPAPFNNFAMTVVNVRPATPVIIPAGATLLAESFTPPSGAIEIGESITLALALRNVGALNANNLVATLLNADGVTEASGPQTYGTLVAGGSAVARNFSFVAQGTNGGGVVATLRLQDGARDLGTVSFTFGLTSDLTYQNPGGLNIPDQGPAALYPAPIFVSGLFGLVNRVTVTLNNLTHSFPDDLDVLLVGPQGQSVMLMSDVGGGADVRNLTLSFDDAGMPLPDQERLTSGSYRPTDFEPGDVFPAPAPAGPYSTNLSVFTGTDPNGIWALYLLDDQEGDSGRLAGGWTLHFSLLDPVNPTADLQVTLGDDPHKLPVGGAVIYTVQLLNRGPDAATGVILSNTFSPVTQVIINSTTQGACTNAGGTIVCQLGILTNSATATVTIVAKPSASGSLICVAAASANERDSNPANSTATAITTIDPVADLALAVSTVPASVVRGEPFTYLLLVTNRGPNNATDLKLTNTLPPEVAFISAQSSQASCSVQAGIVTCSLPSLPPLSQATINVTVQAPNRVTAITNAAVVTANQPIDLDPANNAVTLATAVHDPAIVIVPAGSTLISEQAPYTGGIEPGEQVTLNFALRNVGLSNTVALQAALRNADGVTAASAPQDYGVLRAGGPPAQRAFSFTAGGASGQSLLATFDLRDGANNLGTVTFPYILGGMHRTFANQTPLNVRDYNQAQPYPWAIAVSGLTGTVGKITVTLQNITHTYPDDLDLLLVAPDGQAVVIMSDAGGNNSVNNLTLTLDDNAPEPLPNTLPLQPGIFKPANYPPADAFPAPAPAGPYGAALSALNGASPNGTWALYVLDDTLGDLGTIGGWSLDLTTVGFINYPPARIESPAYSNGQFRCLLMGHPGDVYLIQASSDLITWNTVGSYTLTGSSLLFLDSQTADHRFYRAQRVP